MKHRIREQWESFSRILPRDASATQISEMRRAFYAGVEAMIRINLEVTVMSDDSGAIELQRLDEELAQFAADVKEGRA